MRNEFQDFIDDLRATHGANLAAVILYGSAAAGDFVRRRSDYNLLIVLERITPAELRAAHASIREWSKLGHPVPVYFTVSEIENAADVFPIEFHQMRKARKVLFGRDVFRDVEISGRYLRHQVEYELRSKLILLRRQYIPASASVEGLSGLMAESLSSFAALFGAALILRGDDPPHRKHELIARAVEQFDLSGRPFEMIFNIREDNLARQLDEAEANQLFADYMLQIEKVIDAVNSTGE